MVDLGSLVTLSLSKAICKKGDKLESQCHEKLRGRNNYDYETTKRPQVSADIIPFKILKFYYGKKVFSPSLEVFQNSFAT